MTGAEGSGLSEEAALAAARAHVAAAVSLTKFLIKQGDDSVRPEASRAAETAARSLLQLAAVISPDDAASPATFAMLTEDAETAAELTRMTEQVTSQERTLEEQSAAIAQLKQELADRNEAILQQERDHSAERDRLIEESQSDAARIEEQSQALDEAQEELRKLRAKSDSYAAALRERGPDAPSVLADEDLPEAALTISGVIEIARDECDRVVIPEAAPREIESLEADEKSSDWAREILRGLKALQAYAEEAEHFTGGFWEWCEHSNHPDTWNASPQKLAMSESDTVMNDGRLRRTRRFVIDTKVEPSGYKNMEAHLKIAEGGGQHIPRLYFHDDAKGRTKSMHVGLIGPHRLVPTSHS